MTFYAADGSMNVTVVSGAAITGVQAPDGSTNVVQVNGLSIVGEQHPCGAYNIVNDGTSVGYNHKSGALNVSQFGAYRENTVKVTAVTGVIT